MSSTTLSAIECRFVRESRRTLRNRPCQASIASRLLRGALIIFAALFFGTSTASAQLAFQGFETDTGDWTPITTRVLSGGGVLGLTPASGNYYAELTNIHDSYSVGYGGAEFSFFGFAVQPPYPGDFSQSISMYVFANWPVALYSGPGVWIDMSPGQPSGNFGGEHNFRLTPTGSSVGVTVDGQTTPIVTINTSGWYRFQMTYRKGAIPTDLVSTDMNVFDPSQNLVGTTTVVSNSPGGPLLSQDLAGPNYVWITVWPNGWADDVLAIDNVRADLLHPTKDDCKKGGWQNFVLLPGPFKNQGQCVSYFATRK